MSAAKGELTTIGDLLKQMVVDHHFYGTFILQLVWLVTVQDRLRVVEAMRQTSQAAEHDPELPGVLVEIYQLMMTGHSIESIITLLGERADIEVQSPEEVFLEGPQAIVWKEIDKLLDNDQLKNITLPADARQLLIALLNGGQGTNPLLEGMIQTAETPASTDADQGAEAIEKAAYVEGERTYAEAFDAWVATLTKSIALDGGQQVEVIARNELAAWFIPGYQTDVYFNAKGNLFARNFGREAIVVNNHSSKTKIFVTVADAKQFFLKEVVPHKKYKHVVV